MAKKKAVPRYCLHKKTGHARCKLNGVEHWFGPYNDPESRQKYDDLIAEYLDQDPGTRFQTLTTSQLLAAYWRYAKNRYGKSGKGKWGAAVSHRPAIRLARELYGDTPADQFGPKRLKKVIEAMHEAGWARGYMVDQTARLRKAFKWAVSEELVPAAVHEALEAVEVEPHQGRKTAKVPPVADNVIEATLPFLPPVVVAMIQLQRHTAARPGEVCILRPCDIDRSSEPWVYTPTEHKTEHHGKERHIPIGPQGRKILLPWIVKAAGDDKFCFINTRFKTKPYTTDSYRRAIFRACCWAFPPEGDLARGENETEVAYWNRLTPAQTERVKKWQRENSWAPNQIRHQAATAIRAECGSAEDAQVVLGHSNLDTTEIYAERDLAKAKEVIERIG